MANRPNSRNDNEEDDSGIVGNSSNVTATSDVSSGIMRSFNEAQPGSSSSSYFSNPSSQRGNVSGSFQVMMMADDDDDDDDEDEAEARAIAESRHMFAASSSNNNLRRSPYLSSSTSAFRGSSSNEETIDMATFSPQPSSSGLNIVPTTSGVSSANVSTNDPSVLVKAGISSSSSSNPNQLSSSADVKNGHNTDSQVTESQKSLHGEISNPPSPLGGHNNRNSSANQPRPDSPQAGPSGVKRPLVSDSTSSSTSNGSKQRRQSFESQPGPSGIVQRPQPHRSGQPLTFMAAAAAALHPAGPSNAGPSSTFMAAAAAALQNQSSPRIAPSAGPSNYSAGPSAGPSNYSARPGPSSAGSSSSSAGPSSAGPSTPRIAPQAPIVNLNVSSSEAIPIDNGSDDDDDYGHVGPNLRPPHTPADHYLISSSTGVNDSIPPTPVDVHGDGDLSVPSPSMPGIRHHPNPLNDVDDMIDSTVDSTGYSSVQMNQQRGSNDSNEGPVQSSHYEDSSDDDEGPAQGSGMMSSASGLSRQHSAMESGISTSGQVDEGQFRLVPNNIEDEQYNQYHPPRSSRVNHHNNEAMPNVSSSESSASTSRTNQTSAALGQPGSSRDQNHIFCEPGPSRPRPSSVVHNNGNNGTNNRQRRNNGLDYELDALDNFPDHPVSQGDFDPSNSLIDSVDLEDIQVQNLVPESVDNSSNNAQAAPAASTAPPNAQSTLNKYLNNNAMTKNDLASSASLGNISLAFSRIPGGGKASSSDKAASSSSSSSSSNVNINNHSSILESMTGPLSKRLRTLHSLQQQQNNEAVPQFKVNGNGKKSSNSAEKSAQNSNANNDHGASTSSSVHRSYDPEQDDDNAGGGGGNGNASSSSSSASGMSGGHNIQTYSVTIETNEGNPIKPKKFFQQKSEESGEVKEELFNVIHPLSDEKSNSLALNRSRRHIKKRQMHYCDQCRMEYEQECPLHQPVLLQITDQPIMSRAQQSLPSGYLSLRTSSDDQEGIFARKTIPKNCRFGPVEGEELPLATFDDINDDEEVAFVVVNDNGNLVKLDVSDEDNSNWMRFVRPADRYSEQNLIVSQDGGQLYFSSTRTINPRQELRVWYSPDYAEARGLRVHHPSPEDQGKYRI